MISTENLTVAFGSQVLFEDVNIKFVNENCYGLIGSNGAGKSTFLKILSGEIEPSKGNVSIPDGKRIAVLRQDQFAFDDYLPLDTVLMGHEVLYKIYEERNRLYDLEEMTEEEGLRVGDLEHQFGEMDGYGAEAEAARMLDDLGVGSADQGYLMKDLDPGKKIRVLLAQALFGNPDILLLDEPTNQLDYLAVLWLEKFLLEFENTVIVVSHDRHFLNKVCTHISDIDYKKIKTFVGNYDFWLKSSQLIQKQLQDQHKKQADKIKDLEDFVRRFSANASKSKQATSRKKLIEKIRPEDLAVSSRRTPYIQFKAKRPCGTTILNITDLTHSINGERVINNLNFKVNRGEKVALVGPHTVSKQTLLQILAGEIKPDSGSISWGETIQFDYFPKDNSSYFNGKKSILDWLSEMTGVSDVQDLRGYLGRMLFSGDSVDKSVNVLSGGEKARVMFSKIMLKQPNFILFDEPTDHLDLEAITSLNEGLERFENCLLFTSHDFQLLNTVATRILEVSPKGMLDRPMNFNDYMQSEDIRVLRKKL